MMRVNYTHVRMVKDWEQDNKNTYYIIGQAGASPPSRTYGAAHHM